MVRKLVRQVENVTFGGAQARRQGQEVVYVTEREVFRLQEGGIELIEIAEDVDLQRDILGRMGGVPVIEAPRAMDPPLFSA